ncbi:hypothetical protein, partial [uncultured Tateyamaria sp.]|uniref:hypothetical protein n=1 Tax=uncultured Tateyamaria sp. TaxID=455651 RepID=UPI002629659F
TFRLGCPGPDQNGGKPTVIGGLKRRAPNLCVANNFFENPARLQARTEDVGRLLCGLAHFLYSKPRNPGCLIAAASAIYV